LRVSGGKRRRKIGQYVLITCLVVTGVIGLIVTFVHTGTSAEKDFATAIDFRNFEQTAVADAQGHGRPVYPYSVIARGVYSRHELATILFRDRSVAEHYRDFIWTRAQLVTLHTARRAYVSYRIGDEIFWTRRKVLLKQGEPVLTDGKHYARARCGNRISDWPRTPTSKQEAPPVAFDTPSQLDLTRLPRLGPPKMPPPLNPGTTIPQALFVPILPLEPIIPKGGERHEPKKFRRHPATNCPRRFLNRGP
jgi:hypothetical protein